MGKYLQKLLLCVDLLAIEGKCAVNHAKSSPKFIILFQNKPALLSLMTYALWKFKTRFFLLIVVYYVPNLHMRDQIKSIKIISSENLFFLKVSRYG